MDRTSIKDDVLLDYGAQRSFMNSPSDMDMDFNDVFGGPPRRFSNQEVRSRHSFNDSMESEEDSASSSRSPWTGLIEKPVFGAENSNRRRNACDNFYDDIFKADESCSSPRRSDYKDPFGSNPGSRVLSPVRPLSPKVELLGTSLPAQFSLPAKLTKATDHPLFASGSHSQKKREKEMKNDVPTFYRQSPLSRKVTVKSDDIDMSGSDEKDIGGNLKKNGESMETSSDDYQFHFSIYKWADKGVPILMSLRGGLHFKSKEKIKIERCSSSNGRIEKDSMGISLPLGENLDMSKYPNADSSRTAASENQSYGIVGGNLSIPKSESLQSVKDTAAVDGTSLRTDGVGEKQKTGLFEGSQVEVPRNLEETTRDELKPLRALLVNEDGEQGNIKLAQETEGKSNTVKATKTAQSNVKGNENVKKGDAEVSNSMQKSDSEAKRSGKRGLDRKTKVDKGVKKGSPLGSPLRSTENSTKAGIKGKVQDFVKMFNHEVHSTPREGESRSKSFRWKPSSNNEVESEKGSSTPKSNENVQSPTINKMQDATKPKANENVQLPTINKMQDATANVDQNVNKQEKTTKYSQMKTPTPQTKDGQNLNKQEKTTRYPQMKTPTPQTKEYSDQKTAPSVNESKRDDSIPTVGSMDDLFGGNFVVEELYEDQGKASQTKDYSVDIQASDAKVRQWSQGRKGNIRSLLSTLQLVLWPDSGWKPVALVDLIEVSSVKRSYQRALLYLHPDKLQQKGAAPHQKYIAEKVFDILQEAWDHFNSLDL